MMQIRHRLLIGRLAVVVGAAILAPVVGAGVAEADLRAMETRRGTLTLAPGASGTLTVDCQSWGVTVSGGFSASVVNDVIIDASRPSTTSNGWFVSALNTLTTTQTVDVFAVCASIDGRTVVSRTASVAPSANPDVTRACPTGTSNTGGGYRIDAVPRFTVMSSRPANTGQGWSVMPYNATTVSRSVTVYAICAVFAGRQVVTQSAVLEPGTSADLAATCPSIPGFFNLVVGGGWAHGGATRWLVDRSTMSGLSNWTAHYVNTTPTVRYGITTYAVCATAPL